jgi:hypothetical protein
MSVKRCLLLSTIVWLLISIQACDMPVAPEATGTPSTPAPPSNGRAHSAARARAGRWHARPGL